MYFPHKAKVVVKVMSEQRDKYNNRLSVDPEASEAASKTFPCYARPIDGPEREQFGIDVTEDAYRLTADHRWTGKHGSEVIYDGVSYVQDGNAAPHKGTQLTRHVKLVIRSIGTEVDR